MSGRGLVHKNLGVRAHSQGVVGCSCMLAWSYVAERWVMMLTRRMATKKILIVGPCIAILFQSVTELVLTKERHAVDMASASDWLVLDLGIPGGDDAIASSACGHNDEAQPLAQLSSASSSVVVLAQPSLASSAVVGLQPDFEHPDVQDLELFANIVAGAKRKFRNRSWEHAA